MDNELFYGACSRTTACSRYSELINIDGTSISSGAEWQLPAPIQPIDLANLARSFSISNCDEYLSLSMPRDECLDRQLEVQMLRLERIATGMQRQAHLFMRLTSRV